jgi:Protein of unknown function (DUF1566)
MRIAIKLLTIILCQTLLATSTWAQTCQTKTIEESTPTSRFTFDEAGLVTDKETGITWMRCALGQQWDGATCSGKANTYDWQNAMNEVKKINASKYGGHSDWRLPYIPELASIVERQCFNPRVNLTVFPATPSITFWSGMERMGYADMAYALDFGKGNASPKNKSIKGAVRLMHDGPNGPWWKMPKMN